MNYRHAYHAGNHADVLKHIVLARIFALMARKDTPFAYLDSHSGIGLYDLLGDEASRTGEWESGIGRLVERDDLPELLEDYLGVVSALNPDGGLEFYPGSPELARRLTRPQDRVMLNELHPEDGRLLKANMAGERRISVHQGDGWLLPRAFLPVSEKRGVLLIDPPFEQPDDLERCVTALDEAIGRMRQTVVAIWYPIKDRRQLKRFYQRLEKSSAPKMLRVELCVHPAETADRLNGSGLVIVNPPWPLDEELRGLLPWLAETLAQSEGSSQVDWLIAE
ncbi:MULTISPECIES: 23S rRNA (adenine(2030)-N(6))-methyltransferase RlmJ [Pseudomonadaceae]|uniref:Ribosomal RNA large subunit methyltransferase J n=1 Tax=Pseudomonas denitrificans TaxID=43306 RepID=A0A9X7N2R1_PSEDE|nr:MULTISPECIES: 23S rRNA (adenine(2030)-N(6))-methyltransferase RlmJ [Pseudomonadaceae]MBD9633285.1 23S rRNA (adenine(2030)-N(6))-methyltransferase RlmJ [Pseudomonas sp. PDM19]MBD9686424.1 23S rRNA (adenine(2030)-N(6))-methyltransferase RlmJ [Pseudomonas sp. PDM20]QEY73936.1 23S rRNA (adenine(2030)-N(6))-methyltransferase RlmJ [Pseudomonas denitrificans (nom. rej.)]